MAIVISGINNNDKITDADGTIDLLSGVSYASTITAPAFSATGNITAASINVDNNIQLGNAGVVTATTFVGNLNGNVNGSAGTLLLQTSGSERIRIGAQGQIGLSGENYGTSGQVLTSQGSGSAATWSTINSDKISEGNTEVETIDTGTDGHIKFSTEGSERLNIDSNGKILQTAKTNTTATLDLYGGNTTVSATGEVNGQIRFRSKDNSVTNSEENVGSALKSITEFSNGAYVGMSIETYQQDRSPRLKEAFRISYAGQIGLMGPNYGTAGQVLTSQGPSSPVQWASVSAYNGALDGLNFGGTETTYTSGGTTYKVHSFTSSGFFRVTAAISVDFLIVGGGGGSSNAELSFGSTGGGGAGGMVEGTGITIPAGKHTITVGAGGLKGGTYSVAGNGGDSIFNYGTVVTAKGGGGGSDYGTPGQAGGSGAGGAESGQSGGSSTQSSQNSGISGIQQFGNAGSNAAGYQSGAGGGGGAGSAGYSAGSGNGGDGRQNSITGTNTYYATGGGAVGPSSYIDATPGANGTGDGAGGASSSHPNEGQGAAGGSGIVIIRYIFT